MYAVIESGGKQYRVAVGDRLQVESLNLDPGSKLNLEKVLFLADDNDISVGAPYVSTRVEAKVVGHGRGTKVRILKLRRRKNSRQRAGHRQNFTELEIVSIDGKKATANDKTTKSKASSQDIAEDTKDTDTKTKTVKTKTSVKKVAKKTKKAVTDKAGVGTKKKTTKKKATKKTTKKS